MNLPDALAALAEAAEKNGELSELVNAALASSEWLRDQATLILGEDADTVGIFAQAAQKGEVVQGLVGNLGAELEFWIEYLQSIA